MSAAGGAALPRTRALVLDRWRVVYVVTPKAMCTGLLWALATLQEEPLEATSSSRTAEVTRTLAVHDPLVWRSTRSLHDLPPGEIAAITADDDWFRFCFSRHPVDRLWSAWQSKLLLREPAYAARFGAAAWFPRFPSDGEAVAEDFARFVDALAADPALLTADQHWAPQQHLLRPADFPYTVIGRVEEATATLERLRRHLRAQGRLDGVDPGRRNTGLLPRSAVLRDPALLRRIEERYAADMAAFGYRPAAVGRRVPGGTTALALSALRELAERHERIGDLHRLMIGARPAPVLRAARPPAPARRSAARPRVSLVVLAGPSAADFAVPDDAEVIAVPAGGAAAAFQAGIDASSGEVLALCRDVTALSPGWSERVCRALDDHDTALVGAVVRPVGEPEGRLAGLEFADDLLNCRWRREAEGGEAPLLSSTFLAARRETLAHLGGLDAGMRGSCWHDVELSLRARRTGLACRVLPGVVATWRPPSRQEADEDFVHDLLRLAAVHLSRPRLARLVAALRAWPSLHSSLAAVLTSDVGLRRERLERIAVRDAEDLLPPLDGRPPARPVEEVAS